MDPGVCPECGTRVDARALRKHPLHYVRRRVLRVVLTIAFVLAVGYCTHRFVRDGSWPRWLPNGTLLWFGQAEWSQTDKEILRRLEAGRFSDAEAVALFRDAYSARIILPNRMIRGVPAPVRVRFEPHGVLRLIADWDVQASLRFREWQLSGDGWALRGAGYDGLWLTFEELSLNFELPPLPAGSQMLTYTDTCGYTVSPIAGFPAGYLWSHTLEEAIVVEDVSLEEAVRLRWTETLGAEVLSCVLARAYSDFGPIELEIRIVDPPLPVALEVLWRYSHEEACAFRKAMTLLGGPAHDGTTRVTLDYQAVPVAPIEVHVRPAPIDALYAGATECFGGTLEWDRLMPIEREQGEEGWEWHHASRVFRAVAAPLP